MDFLISILTIIGSGVAAGVVTFSLNKNHQLDIQRKQRLEELYERVDEYERMIGSSLLPYAMAMAGKINYNQANDMFIKNDLNKSTILRARLLVHMYFPQLKEDFSSFEELKNKSINLVAQFRHSYEKDGMPRKDILTELNDISNQMDKSIHRLKETIVELV